MNAQTTTALARARVTARRLSEALADLSPEERLHILGQVVVKAPPGPDGQGFALLVSHPPTPDPMP